MKKFISALASLTIAATALGGTFALSSNAINEALTETIVDIRTGTSNEIQAKAGDKIPVSVYVPQSAGFNTMTLYFAINDGDPQATLKTTDGDIPYKFNNYGFKINKGDFPRPCAVDSGVTTYKKSVEGGDDPEDAAEDAVFNGAGYAKAGSYAQFHADTWTMFYQAGHATTLKTETNIDAYGEWAKNGGNLDLETFDYANYTPAYTWSKSESWAYDYALVNFELEVPAGIADGVYTLGTINGNYLNVASEADADTYKGKTYDTADGADNGGPKLYLGVSPQAGNSTSKPKVTVVPLKIKVGEGVETTTQKQETQAPETTTTKEAIQTGGQTGVPTPEGTVRYDLTAEGSSFDGTINTVKAAPGSQVTVALKISNDPGTAGMQYYFDFGAIVKNGGTYDKKKNGRAYTGLDLQLNDGETATTGRFDYVWAAAEEQQAEDGATLYSWTFTVPDKNGSYKLDLLPESDTVVHQTVPLEKGQIVPHIFYGLNIVVGDTETETQAPVTTTTAKVTTTTAKVTTTTAKVTTTQAPITTTSAQITSTQAPVTTTSEEITETVPAGDVFWGDTNCDQKVSIADVVLLNKGITNADKLNDLISAQGQKNADVVNDGQLKADDSTAIKKFLAKMIDKLPVA